MAVRIRMKRMGRRHRPFYRVCAVDRRNSRDGKVIEYLGYYDPMVPETDARAVLESERIDYWLGVGAQPSDKVAVLIKKYGTNGTHLEQQQAARERLQANKPTAPPPVPIPRPDESTEQESTEQESTEQEAAEAEQSSEGGQEATAEQPAAEQTGGEEAAAAAPQGAGTDEASGAAEETPAGESADESAEQKQEKAE